LGLRFAVRHLGFDVFSEGSLAGRLNERHNYLFLAVLADSLKSLAVGAPLAPGFRIFSPLPAAIRARFAWIAA
jgi:hypothetical protein